MADKAETRTKIGISRIRMDLIVEQFRMDRGVDVIQDVRTNSNLSVSSHSITTTSLRCQKTYSSARDVIRKTFHIEGVQGFYKGYPPTYLNSTNPPPVS